ncbi:hypothetical protein [Mesorhizobium sp.]|uniref:hypothetical protein n=1 Tax=Mesorhizobium sp. TaxID=1871066 RepID=UPI0025C13060|nr:hypothetical protein [Mesorhizobium sp.]
MCIAAWQSRSRKLGKNYLWLALPATAHLNRVANRFCQSIDSVERLEATGQKAGGLTSSHGEGRLGVGQSSILPEQVDGLSGMSLPKFIVGMIFALAIVVAGSLLGGASLGTTLFRVIACAIVIQLGYFLLVFAMVVRNAPASADRILDIERKLGSTEDGEKFSARRSLR